ncbi:hypothetical protein Lalb_Chr23g0272301 [Lupinus albus]|uniref:Uncharacterized protein n=1 Tax=Lupinus albus TaxID=3870 RepID=A0A6A4NCZ0_LUPAL|nr:hypothetical protein Lalb_Chr23g0272301 [Lupinus albus]
MMLLSSGYPLIGGMRYKSSHDHISASYFVMNGTRKRTSFSFSFIILRVFLISCAHVGSSFISMFSKVYSHKSAKLDMANH